MIQKGNVLKVNALGIHVAKRKNKLIKNIEILNNLQLY